MGRTDLPPEISAELDLAMKAEAEGNDGKARVCARRAVGKAFALSTYSTGYPAVLSATQILKILAELCDLPEDVRGAAQRLVMGVAEKGESSISLTPIADADLIIRRLLAK